MSAFTDDLLRASTRLLARRGGQKGPLKSAYVRRSLSTTYYAVFHFCLDEAARRLVGTGHELRRRRRSYIRTFSHAGLTTALGKIKGPTIDATVVDLFRTSSMSAGPVVTPMFVQQLATAYLDAKGKREDADYNLNEHFGETDARLLARRVRRAIKGWEAATTKADRDTKHAVAILLSLKGRLRDT